MKLLPKTQALHIYTVARLENLLRTQAVSAPEGTDNGISTLLSSELAKLSNTYRIKHRKDPEKPYFVEIAHNLAMYALRFKRPDSTGYSQTLAHWLDLDVSVFSRNKSEYDRMEETLKLSLALSETGYGAEYYGHHYAEKLKDLYSLQGKETEAQAIAEHYKDIPNKRHFVERWQAREDDIAKKGP